MTCVWVTSQRGHFDGQCRQAPSICVGVVQAHQVQQQLQQQPREASHKAALQLGEVLTQKLIQLDNVDVTGTLSPTLLIKYLLCGTGFVACACTRFCLISRQKQIAAFDT